MTHRRPKRSLSTLLEKGILATFIGVAFLAAPAFFGSSAVLKALAMGLRLPGWAALGLGLALLCLHFILKARVQKTSEVPITLPDRREPSLTKQTVGSATKWAPPPPASTWSPVVFAAIEWRRFEAVCETLFAQAGFETRSQSHGADGGVDIWLHSANAPGPVAVVQCKHWQGKAVGVKEIREFFGVMASHQVKRGTYATTSTFTADAQQFAKDNGINAMDGPALLDLIAKRTPEQQQALLAVAFEGEYWRPTCASCGIKMLERQPSQGGAAFWGCSNYPRCKSRLSMVAAMR